MKVLFILTFVILVIYQSPCFAADTGLRDHIHENGNGDHSHATPNSEHEYQDLDESLDDDLDIAQTQLPKLTLKEYKEKIRQQQRGGVEPINSVPDNVFVVRDSDLSGSASKNDKSAKLNFASQSAGAAILAKNPEAKGTKNLLMDDPDTYSMSPCDENKFVVIGLSEDVMVDSVEISNYERYSSRIKDFLLLGSQQYPTEEWILLGNFTAEDVHAEQTFTVTSKPWIRYLKLAWLSHYGNEFYCILTNIEVYGSTIVQDFHAEMQKDEADQRATSSDHEPQSTTEEILDQTDQTPLPSDVNEYSGTSEINDSDFGTHPSMDRSVEQLTEAEPDPASLAALTQVVSCPPIGPCVVKPAAVDELRRKPISRTLEKVSRSLATEQLASMSSLKASNTLGLSGQLDPLTDTAQSMAFVSWAESLRPRTCYAFDSSKDSMFNKQCNVNLPAVHGLTKNQSHQNSAKANETDGSNSCGLPTSVSDNASETHKASTCALHRTASGLADQYKGQNAHYFLPNWLQPMSINYRHELPRHEDIRLLQFSRTIDELQIPKKARNPSFKSLRFTSSGSTMLDSINPATDSSLLQSTALHNTTLATESNTITSDKDNTNIPRNHSDLSEHADIVGRNKSASFSPSNDINHTTSGPSHTDEKTTDVDDNQPAQVSDAKAPFSSQSDASNIPDATDEKETVQMSHPENDTTSTAQLELFKTAMSVCRSCWYPPFDCQSQKSNSILSISTMGNTNKSVDENKQKEHSHEESIQSEDTSSHATKPDTRNTIDQAKDHLSASSIPHTVISSPELSDNFPESENTMIPTSDHDLTPSSTASACVVPPIESKLKPAESITPHASHHTRVSTTPVVESTLPSATASPLPSASTATPASTSNSATSFAPVGSKPGVGANIFKTITSRLREVELEQSMMDNYLEEWQQQFEVVMDTHTNRLDRQKLQLGWMRGNLTTLHDRLISAENSLHLATAEINAYKQHGFEYLTESQTISDIFDELWWARCIASISVIFTLLATFLCAILIVSITKYWNKLLRYHLRNEVQAAVRADGSISSASNVVPATQSAHTFNTPVMAASVAATMHSSVETDDMNQRFDHIESVYPHSSNVQTQMPEGSCTKDTSWNVPEIQTRNLMYESPHVSSQSESTRPAYHSQSMDLLHRPLHTAPPTTNTIEPMQSTQTSLRSMPFSSSKPPLHVSQSSLRMSEIQPVVRSVPPTPVDHSTVQDLPSTHSFQRLRPRRNSIDTINHHNFSAASATYSSKDSRYTGPFPIASEYSYSQALYNTPLQLPQRYISTPNTAPMTAPYTYLRAPIRESLTPLQLPQQHLSHELQVSQQQSYQLQEHHQQVPHEYRNLHQQQQPQQQQQLANHPQDLSHHHHQQQQQQQVLRYQQEQQQQLLSHHQEEQEISHQYQQPLYETISNDHQQDQQQKLPSGQINYVHKTIRHDDQHHVQQIPSKLKQYHTVDGDVNPVRLNKRSGSDADSISSPEQDIEPARQVFDTERHEFVQQAIPENNEGSNDQWIAASDVSMDSITTMKYSEYDTNVTSKPSDYVAHPYSMSYTNTRSAGMGDRSPVQNRISSITTNSPHTNNMIQSNLPIETGHESFISAAPMTSIQTTNVSFNTHHQCTRNDHQDSNVSFNTHPQCTRNDENDRDDISVTSDAIASIVDQHIAALTASEEQVKEQYEFRKHVLRSLRTQLNNQQQQQQLQQQEFSSAEPSVVDSDTKSTNSQTDDTFVE